MNLRQSVFVLRLLILRDFKTRYRNMSLGFLWFIANPLIMVLILNFVFAHIFPNPESRAFPVFLLCGLIPYNFVTLAWSAGTASIQINSNLVRKIRMPRVLLPIAAVFSIALHFLAQMMLLLVFAMIWGFFPAVQWLWILYFVVLLTVTACGLALLCSATDVMFRDTRYIVDSLILVLFWFTPIFYSEKRVPAEFRPLFQSNPIASVATGLRSVLMESRQPDLIPLLRGTAAALILLIAGYSLFMLLQKRFPEHI